MASWKINLHNVYEADGVKVSRSVTSTFYVELPAGGGTTVKEFFEIVKNHPEQKGGDLSLMDLAPLDESKLGRDTGYYGQRQSSGHWVPAHENPRPVNCAWNPSPDDPHQFLRDTGLVDGADVAIFKRVFYED